MPSTTKGSSTAGKPAKKVVRSPKAASASVASKVKKEAKKPTVTKTAAKKPAATKKAVKAAKSSKVAKAIITSEDRHSMIAEAAYYIAEKRGFVAGNAENDWAKAAQAIDEMIING